MPKAARSPLVSAPAACMGIERLLRAAWRVHPVWEAFERSEEGKSGENPFALDRRLLSGLCTRQSILRFPNGFSVSLVLFGKPEDPASLFEIAPLVGGFLLDRMIQGRLSAQRVADVLSAFEGAPPEIPKAISALRGLRHRSLRRALSALDRENISLFLSDAESILAESLLSSDPATRAAAAGRCLAAFSEFGVPSMDFPSQAFAALSRSLGDESAALEEVCGGILPAAFRAGYPTLAGFPFSDAESERLFSFGRARFESESISKASHDPCGKRKSRASL